MPKPLTQSDDFSLTEFERKIAARFLLLEQAEENCRLLWERLDRQRRNFARLAGLGRKRQVVVRISETEGVQIKNQFRQVDKKNKPVDKVFTPAFCRKWDIAKIKLPA